MIFSHPIAKVLKPFIGYCARQLVTQGIIEPNFGADLVSPFTNGINHIPCQKNHGSPPISQGQRHREF